MNSRIADIQSRMIALQTQQATRTVQNQGTSATKSTTASGETNPVEIVIS